jgi:hypothetical protein
MSGSTEPTKMCPDCGHEKRATEFSRNAARPDGLQFYCKKCFAARSARTYRQRQLSKGKVVREPVEVPAGHKLCPGCKQVKPRTEWHRRTSASDGLNVYCKACSSQRSRRDYLKRTFGLTPEELDAMIAAQGGVCAICRDGKPEHIDHDHETGRVRGVLCGPCNMGLGLFKDDPARLDAAIGYLRLADIAKTMHEVEHTCCVIELDSARLHAA